MGNFYVNFSVQTKQQQLVVDVLKQAKRVAIVTPPQGEYVVVYDEEADSQDNTVIQQLAAVLSKVGPTLAILNHDDDILCYWLYEAGKEIVPTTPAQSTLAKKMMSREETPRNCVQCSMPSQIRPTLKKSCVVSTLLHSNYIKN